MDAKMQEARFAESMTGLGDGDLICRLRDGTKEYTVVLRAQVEKDGTKKLMLSRFSKVASMTPWPRTVGYRDGWLADEAGSVLLLPEEWESTEKEGAKSLLPSITAYRDQEWQRERVLRIVSSIANQSNDFSVTAREILEMVGHNNPDKWDVELVAVALGATARHVWQ